MYEKIIVWDTFLCIRMLVARGEGVRFLDNVAWKQVVKEAREAWKNGIRGIVTRHGAVL